MKACVYEKDDTKTNSSFVVLAFGGCHPVLSGKMFLTVYWAGGMLWEVYPLP